MNKTRMQWGGLVLVGAIALGALVMNRAQPVGGAEPEKKAASGPHYSVLETEGHNLIVTDNESNTLYFYTVDKGEPIGAGSLGARHGRSDPGRQADDQAQGNQHSEVTSAEWQAARSRAACRAASLFPHAYSTIGRQQR